MNHITAMKNYHDYRQFQFFESVKNFGNLTGTRSKFKYQYMYLIVWLNTSMTHQKIQSFKDSMPNTHQVSKNKSKKWMIWVEIIVQ